MLTAIFGGTFNPFHIGHDAILNSLQEDKNIEKILLMPDRIPPHKTSRFLIDDEIRKEMCKIAAAKYDKCELCLIEFEREGKSYSYDTVKLLQERFPNTEFAFVCGGDMLVTFDKWYNYKELIKMIPFIVFRREDELESQFDSSALHFKGIGMKLILKKEIIPAISSSYIRENFTESEKFLPTEIYSFLKERGAYGDS